MPRRVKKDEGIGPTLMRREDRGRFVELEDEGG